MLRNRAHHVRLTGLLRANQHLFHCLGPPMQLNKRGIDFGCRSGGQPVGDVQLPPWAADAQDFLCKLQVRGPCWVLGGMCINVRRKMMSACS